MTDAKRLPPVPNGPYMILAGVCDGVDQTEDEGMTVRGLTHGFVRYVTGPTSPSTPVTWLSLYLVFLLQAGDAIGEHLIEVWTTSPSGNQVQRQQFPITLDDAAVPGGFWGPFRMVTREAGVYWLTFVAGDKVLALSAIEIEDVVVSHPQGRAS